MSENTSPIYEHTVIIVPEGLSSDEITTGTITTHEEDIEYMKGMIVDVDTKDENGWPFTARGKLVDIIDVQDAC